MFSPIGTFSCFSEQLQYLIYVYQSVVNFGRDLKMECRPLKSSTCPRLCLAEEQPPGLRLLQPEIEARSLLLNPQLTQNNLPSIPYSFLTRTPMPPDNPGSSTGLIARIFIIRSGSGIKARKAHGPEVNLLLERINNSATSVWQLSPSF